MSSSFNLFMSLLLSSVLQNESTTLSLTGAALFAVGREAENAIVHHLSAMNSKLGMFSGKSSTPPYLLLLNTAQSKSLTSSSAKRFCALVLALNRNTFSLGHGTSFFDSSRQCGLGSNPST